MVGFGSSLRLARRPGWDGAYFDYETLKLLLSQIEAVYEDVQQQWGLDPNDDDDTTDNTDILQDHPRRRNTGRTDDDIDDENPPNSRQQRRHRRIHRPNQQQQQSKQSRGNKNNNSNSLPEQLFLESDSDVAYGSMEEEDDDDDGNADNGDDQDDFYGTEEEEDPVQPFSLSHSQKRRNNKNEPISYASVDADNDDEGETTAQRQQNSSLCWGGTGNSSSSSSGWNASSKHGPNKSHHSSSSKAQKKREHSTAQFLPSIPDGTEEDAFYNILTGTMQHSATKASGGNNRAAANRFYMTAPNNISSNNNPNSQVNASALNDYFNQTTLQYFPTPTTPTPSNNNETTRLLPSTRTSDSVATTPTSLLYTFSSSAAGGGNLSPPSLGFFPRQQTNNASSSYDHPVGGGGGEHSKNSLSTDVFSSPMLPPYLRKGNRRSHASSMPRSTKPSRRQHRSRRQRNCLKQRNVVPRNLQIAHTKARAITERFLGLLRAETEKVMLFAQSRLGELADTAGSLRFPAFDEHSSTNNANRISSGNDGKTGGTYEFGDGGMHPSASSSSDDGAVGGLNGRQWTDSSDDEHDYDEKSNSGKVKISGRHHSLPTKRNGPMGVSPSASAYISMSKSVSGGGLSDDTPTNATARTKDMNGMYMVRRQIAHFEALRKNRVVFQRNEQILGEDMLFLSAVEEADGYTAVGVELIHVLKYVCVNLIAVRKICRKHDRLLMNRMLGGYYKTHGRNSPQDDSGRNTLGGMLARVSGDIYEAHPALIGQLNHYKLVGVYDKKIQKLANSRTVQVVSSCLALSLSEYEVARSRANALTILTRKDDTDDDSIDDSPSTASTISLTRLRFTVMSIFSLREVSRSKRQYFLSYLARATLAFTGIPVAGGGLDGCSRETLGFLVAYDPDAALLRDSGLLFEGLQRSQWARLPLADVMISTLAVATIPGDVSDDFASGILSTEQITVASAVSASPESKGSVWKGIIHGQLTRRRRFIAAKTLPPIALEHSRLSLFLYTVRHFSR